MGGPFTSKDFRTWAGTLICACALARVGVEAREPATSKKRQRFWATLLPFAGQPIFVRRFFTASNAERCSTSTLKLPRT
jgi:DNA topoisomerase IB